MVLGMKNEESFTFIWDCIITRSVDIKASNVQEAFRKWEMGEYGLNGNDGKTYIDDEDICGDITINDKTFYIDTIEFEGE